MEAPWGENHAYCRRIVHKSCEKSEKRECKESEYDISSINNSPIDVSVVLTLNLSPCDSSQTK